MIRCKRCGSGEKIRNGIHNGKQRYKCKRCRYSYVEGDGRTNYKVKAKKSMAVLLYSVGKVSIRMIASILDTWPSLVCYWLRQTSEQLPDYEISNDVEEIEFDEMWHFLERKKTNFG